MTVLVERSPVCGAADADAAGARLAHMVKSMVGVTAEMVVDAARTLRAEVAGGAA